MSDAPKSLDASLSNTTTVPTENTTVQPVPVILSPEQQELSSQPKASDQEISKNEASQSVAKEIESEAIKELDKPQETTAPTTTATQIPINPEQPTIPAVVDSTTSAVQTQPQIQSTTALPSQSTDSNASEIKSEPNKPETTAPKAKFLEELKNVMAEAVKPKEKTLEEKKELVRKEVRLRILLQYQKELQQSKMQEEMEKQKKIQERNKRREIREKRQMKRLATNRKLSKKRLV